MASNIQIAKQEADRCNIAEKNSRGYNCFPFGRKPDDWFGEDSDFKSIVWYVGGNAAIVRLYGNGEEYHTMRLHDLIQTTKNLKHRIQ